MSTILKCDYLTPREFMLNEVAKHLKENKTEYTHNDL